uniref:Orf74b protein n=1 Tax=Moineauvirus Sfi21 TaxID=64186 RepID=O21994_9CAUD|nr:orf74b [Moineauvirus Sfi21]
MAFSMMSSMSVEEISFGLGFTFKTCSVVKPKARAKSSALFSGNTRLPERYLDKVDFEIPALFANSDIDMELLSK